jgi:exodeoxyribonuclease V alpha subunit
VLITRNSPHHNLYNGDIGITVEGPCGMVVVFPRGDKVVVMSVRLLPEHEPAYAITVHKSQGSEFENVLVVLPNDGKNPLLSRSLIYTGVTRAKKRAVVMGTESAIKKSLKTVLLRETGLGPIR